MDMSLDELLLALHASLARAQETLSRRNDEVESAVSSRGDHFFVMEGQDQKTCETISLPEASLRALRRHQVSMFSLSCDCKLKRAAPFFLSRGYCLCILGRKDSEGGNKPKPRRGSIRMQVVFRGTENPVGEIWLDGVLLTSLPPEGEPKEKQEQPVTQGSIFSRFFHLLFGFACPEGFVLNREQSDIVKQVMRQRKTVAG